MKNIKKIILLIAFLNPSLPSNNIKNILGNTKNFFFFNKYALLPIAREILIIKKQPKKKSFCTICGKEKKNNNPTCNALKCNRDTPTREETEYITKNNIFPILLNTQIISLPLLYYLSKKNNNKIIHSLFNIINDKTFIQIKLNSTFINIINLIIAYELNLLPHLTIYLTQCLITKENFLIDKE